MLLIKKALLLMLLCGVCIADSPQSKWELKDIRTVVYKGTVTLMKSKEGKIEIKYPLYYSILRNKEAIRDSREEQLARESILKFARFTLPKKGDAVEKKQRAASLARDIVDEMRVNKDGSIIIDKEVYKLRLAVEEPKDNFVPLPQEDINKAVLKQWKQILSLAKQL